VVVASTDGEAYEPAEPLSQEKPDMS
jgi:hypothetical protein